MAKQDILVAHQTLKEGNQSMEDYLKGEMKNNYMSKCESVAQQKFNLMKLPLSKAVLKQKDLNAFIYYLTILTRKNYGKSPQIYQIGEKPVKTFNIQKKTHFSV